jgi:hypothetical protein
VLFIGGFGRSGSTLLDRMLGQLPGFVSLGEVKYLWERGLVEDQLCGCGAPFRACPFWTDVGRRGFGGWDRIDPHDVIGLLRSIDRHRYVPGLLAPSLAGSSLRRRLARVGGVLGRLYAAIRDVSGARVLVDSSVDPSTALMLKGVPGIDLRVIHLVRDSRGVAASWAKRVVRPEVVETTTYMASYRPSSTAARWAIDNALFEAIHWTGVPTTRARYEGSVADPRSTLIRLAGAAGALLRDDDLAFVGGSSVELAQDHTVAGNPMRFRIGTVGLRVDEEWRRTMPARSRFAVTALTWPLLRRYGYGRDGPS